MSHTLICTGCAGVLFVERYHADAPPVCDVCWGTVWTAAFLLSENDRRLLRSFRIDPIG